MRTTSRAVLLLSLLAGCGASNPEPQPGGTPGPGPGEDGGTTSDSGDASSLPPPPPGDGGFVPGASGCKPIGIERGVSVDGYNSDKFTFHDADCKSRSA